MKRPEEKIIEKNYYKNVTIKLRKEDAIILNKYGYDFVRNFEQEAENVAKKLRKAEENDYE